MNKTVLKSELQNGVELSLNRPEKLNVLNDDVISELREALIAIEKDSHIDHVFLSGQGAKGFCAGGDVVNVIHYKGDRPLGHFFKAEYEVDLMIHNFSKPITGLCHGIIMGGGVGLVNGTSTKVFDKKTLLAMPEVTIGLFPDVGSSYFLNKLEKKWCFFLAMTGARLKSSQSYALGLCDYVIDKESWEQLRSSVDHTHMLELCRKLHHCEKVNLDEYRDLDAINDMASVEEFDFWARNYLERANAHPWIKSSIEVYLQGSPLSAKIIWSYFTWAKGKSIEDCFEKDYELGQMMLESSDFKEGVRALLVDKDKSPKWMFNKISEIDANLWAKYESLLSV